ncbi:ABC transporter permease [Mycolicibacterium sp. S2-37]|uniref:ABC transporter permease n=1 Tax=Mycolicibacterium sp. S2-37 TaxID=2810297 RepID=UPI001A94B660|nr:ABC transporter permease [Mycolicibacterium sp. S2-37]MBO0681338.1 ABC transporter permease [Mycolicibacterium sp. S2-37]
MTTTSQTGRPHHRTATGEPPPAVRAAGIVAVLCAAMAIVALAFALPATRSAPHGVPIGIAGPQAANGRVADTLEQRAPGAFAVTYYPGEDALRDAIAERHVYGGLALDPAGPTMLIASGASPAVAQLLTQIGTGMAEQTGRPPAIEDVAPLPADDPRGAGLAASALPVTLAGILPAVALVFALRREVWTRLGAAVAFAGAAALTIAALLVYVLGSVEHNFWGVTAGLTLGLLGCGLPILGLGSVFGRTGLAVGAVLALLLGNPLSGLTSAPEMLPSGWGTLGQWLPQGANATLLRSTAYFDGAGATSAVVVLTCWALAGAALVAIAAVRGRSRAIA